eukprot:13152882-Alexandrium_andersonii.AAC.1
MCIRDSLQTPRTLAWSTRRLRSALAARGSRRRSCAGRDGRRRGKVGWGRRSTHSREGQKPPAATTR